MVIELRMLSVRLTYPLLIISLFISVFSLPVLNSKDQEISWQAWLLIDEQNQNRQMEPRRRITAKSVFDVPPRKIATDSELHPCDEGYTTDETGKCIKIIKIDEDQQLEFLLNEMNLDLDILDPSNSEPLHFNIPLDDNDPADYITNTPEEQTNVALILTPVAKDMKQSDEETKVVKKDEKANEMANEQELKELIKAIKSHEYDTTSLVPVIDEMDTTTASSTIIMEYENDDNVETTIMDSTTTVTPTTTMESLIETTTKLYEQENDDSTTTITDTTTTATTVQDQTTTTDANEIITTTTTIPKITTYHPKVTTYHPQFNRNTMSRNPIRFPQIDDQRAHSTDRSSYVKFPDMDVPYQQESESHQSRDASQHFGNYFNQIVTPLPSERLRQMLQAVKGVTKSYYQSYNNPSESYILPKPSYGIQQFRKNIYNNFKFPKRELLTTNQDHYSDYKQYGATTENLSLFYGKRNRDKQQGNIFLLPPPPPPSPPSSSSSRWIENNHRRPLVIRFPRKVFSNIDTNKLKSNKFYRSLPMEDVSVLFGYNNKHGQSVNR